MMLRSTIDHAAWPGVPNHQGGAIASLVRQFEDTQWWSPEKIRDHQFLQLPGLLAHFEATSPFWRERQASRLHPTADDLTADNFQDIPILTRAAYQEAGDDLYSTAPPEEHGAIREYTTSGSTGRPLNIRTTDLNDVFHRALTIRNDLWHGRDFGAKFVFLQCLEFLDEALPPDGTTLGSWAGPFATGPLVQLNILHSTLDEQIDFLERHKPRYLMTFGSNMAALARRTVERGITFPWLENVSAFGEGLSPAQRRTVESIWNVPVKETYGAGEASMIAFQCPEHEHLLVQSENVIVEILGDDDQPCAPGEVGRVVVTDFHNFATPIIHYEIGDLAAWGKPCPAGRGLPVIDHVHGRIRDMVQFASGKRAFPLRWPKELAEIAPVRQMQVVQKSYTEMEIRMVVPQPLSSVKEREFLSLLAQYIGPPFTLTPVYVNDIPRAASGKFQEFICEIED